MTDNAGDQDRFSLPRFTPGEPGLRPRVDLFDGQRDNPVVVRAGMGVAVLPWLAVHGADVWSDDQLRVHELRAPPVREMYLHWPAGRTRSPLAVRTIEIAVKVADELSTQQ